MKKRLDIKALEKAMREPVKLAKHGTPAQKAGSFAPSKSGAADQIKHKSA